MSVSDLPPARDWSHFVRLRLAVGWSPSLLTFMFAPMAGDALAIGRQQAREVHMIYGRLVTRVVRRPNAPLARDRLPIWLCAADLPVWKHAKVSLREVTINDGLHVQALALMPPRHRLGDDLCTFVERNQALLHGHGRCCRVHATSVFHDASYVFDYVTKAVACGRVEPEAFFVLPRSRSEVRDGGEPIGRNASLFGSSRG